MDSDKTIFISYAHIDDQPLVEGEQGWISAFHSVLEKRLSMLLGEPPNIWRDAELRGNDRFDDAIARAFHRAAVFIAVLTPRYVRSDYCQMELDAFTTTAAREGRERVGDRRPLFKVIKTPVARDDHPTELQDQLGYEFFVQDPGRKHPSELSLSSRRDDFLVLLDDLAHEIRETLEQLDETDANPAATPVDPGTGKVIYLAPPTSDLRGFHDALRRELVDEGHAVLPDTELPVVGGPFLETVDRCLAGADLAVHLLGPKYGFVPEDETTSAGELQLMRSAARASSLERLIWIPPECTPTDARQAALLERVRRDPTFQEGADVVNASLETLKQSLRGRLVPAPAVPESPHPGDDADTEPGGPAWVYLIHDPQDDDAAAEVEDALWDAGVEVRTRIYEGDETEIREDHEENLRVCDAFLVFHGSAGERWLRQALADLKRARGLGRTAPIRARAVLVAPPLDARKARFRSREAQVLHAENGFEPATLAPFLAELRADAEAPS